MRALLLLCLILSVNASHASAESNFENALLNNDIKLARESLNELQNDNSWYFVRDKKDFNSLENLVNLFESIDSFSLSSAKYIQTKEAANYEQADIDFSRILKLQGDYKTYTVSQDVINYLNSRIKLINEKNLARIALYNNEVKLVAENARALALKEKLIKAESDRLQLESMRERDAEIARIDAANDAAEENRINAEIERRQKLCGKDFNRFYIGMQKKRLLLCMPLSHYAAREGGIDIYRTDSGSLITVKNNKVFSWIR